MSSKKTGKEPGKKIRHPPKKGKIKRASFREKRAYFDEYRNDSCGRDKAMLLLRHESLMPKIAYLSGTIHGICACCSIYAGTGGSLYLARIDDVMEKTSARRLIEQERISLIKDALDYAISPGRNISRVRLRFASYVMRDFFTALSHVAKSPYHILQGTSIFLYRKFR